MKMTMKQAIRKGFIKVAGPKPQWIIDEEKSKDKKKAKRRKHNKLSAKARKK